MLKHFFISLFFVIILNGSLWAQMPHDAIYMPKKTVCLAFMAGNSSWSEYWENTLKRENLNMGTHKTNSMNLMVAAGITDKLNFIAALPFIQTQTTAGNLKSQKGLQDASAWLKYKILEKSGLSAHAALGGSMPVSNYVPDFLPMSIGLQSKTASGRLLANYLHKTGFYTGVHGTYTLRSNIKVDRDAYQAYGKVINSSEVAIPNVFDAAVRLGYLKPKYQVEVFWENSSCIGGDDIRRNDMPFPTNNMQSNTAGAYLKFQPKNLGFNVAYRTVLSGLNVGQSSSYTVGLLYILKAHN
jgi:hypothetical protein